MKRIGLLTVLPMLAACLSLPTTAAHSPGPSAGTASASPTTLPSVPPAGAVSLNCRLPVRWVEGSGTGAATIKWGFLSFPSQTIVEDPRAQNGSVFYDRAYSTWLPVTRDAVSPDGSEYVYGRGDSIHGVDVATGAEHLLYMGATPTDVVDFETGAIYTTLKTGENTTTGLWAFPTGGPIYYTTVNAGKTTTTRLSAGIAGDPREISGTVKDPFVGNGAAWGVDFNHADPHPAAGATGNADNEVLRFDLLTEESVPWFYQPGAALSIIGLDYSGHIFVSASYDDFTQFAIWKVSSASQAQLVFKHESTGAAFDHPLQVSAVDSNGVWFTNKAAQVGRSVVWLLASGAVYPAATVDKTELSVAGGCIPGGG